MTLSPARPRRSSDGSLAPLRDTVRNTRTSVTEDAITRIRQMILTGELAPGDRLPPEGNLAANLGLSRTSLREAVRALTVLGVIDTRQGDASYITSLGPELLLRPLGLTVDLQREDTMPDLVAVRRILEPAATAMAASRITVEEVERLRSSSRQRSMTSKQRVRGARLGVSPRHRPGWRQRPAAGASRRPGPADHANAHLAWAYHPGNPGPESGRARGDRRRARVTRCRLGPCRRHRPRRRPRGLDPIPRTRLEHPGRSRSPRNTQLRWDDLTDIWPRINEERRRAMTTAVNDRIWDDLRRPTPGWLPAAKLGSSFIGDRTRSRPGPSRVVRSVRYRE